MALIIWTSTFKLVKSIWGFFLHTLSTSYIKELFNIFTHFIINSLVFHFKQFNSECTEILHTPNAFVYRAFFSRLSCVTTHFKSLRTLKKKKLKTTHFGKKYIFLSKRVNMVNFNSIEKKPKCVDFFKVPCLKAAFSTT